MKEQEPLISVIIPCYNVEAYLKRCLDSIQKQTYQNLEILIINDGSTDGSLKIAESYAKIDDRFKIYNQENQGIASSRKRGLDKSSGKYITFVDPDDYVTEDYVQFMYDLIADHQFRSPMALCSLENVFEKTGHRFNQGNNQITCLTGKQCLESMLYNGLVDTSSVAKLVRRDLYFSPDFPGFKPGYQFEDTGTTYALFLQSPQVECGFLPKYFYYVRQKSITTSKFSLRKLDLVTMTDQMTQAIVDKYPDLKAAATRKQVYARFSTLNQTLGYPSAKKYQTDLVRFIKSHKREVMDNPKTPKRDRMAYHMLALGLPFYRFAWGAYLKFIAHKK